MRAGKQRDNPSGGTRFTYTIEPNILRGALLVGISREIALVCNQRLFVRSVVLSVLRHPAVVAPDLSRLMAKVSRLDAACSPFFRDILIFTRDDGIHPIYPDRASRNRCLVFYNVLQFLQADSSAHCGSAAIQLLIRALIPTRNISTFVSRGLQTNGERQNKWTSRSKTANYSSASNCRNRPRVHRGKRWLSRPRMAIW